jgi:putative endonuclease
MSYFLYFIQSKKDQEYYIGISKNLEQRLSQHSAGKTFSTRSRKPFKLVYTEQLTRLAEARKREKFLKSYAGVKEKRKIIDTLGE